MSSLVNSSFVFLLAFFALGLNSKVAQSQSIEYLPGLKWDVPQVVTPSDAPGGAPSDAIVLFDGSDLSAWHGGENWRVEEGVAICQNGNITTKQMFGDCQLHIEWSVPNSVTGSSQDRGNSGVFLMGKYEVQVLDSYENGTYPDGQAGAIYKQTPPAVNAMRPQNEWNVYDIFWTCPVMEDEVVTKPATVTVVHNGVLVVNHHEVAGGTYWHKPPAYEDLNDRDEAGNLVGPIALQDHGNPVQFRNIWIRELKAPTSTPREAMYIDHSNGKKWSADENQPE